jgi:hypothetical protein
MKAKSVLKFQREEVGLASASELTTARCAPSSSQILQVTVHVLRSGYTVKQAKSENLL